MAIILLLLEENTLLDSMERYARFRNPILGRPFYNDFITMRMVSPVVTSRNSLLPPLSLLQVFIPINMGRIDPSKTPIESMKQRVSVHVKIASSGDRYIYTQSYKRNGRWETKSAITNMYTQHTWPLSPNKPFWIRIVAVSEGFVTYLDGQVMCFTPHADGVPVENENLYLYFPVAGDVGEKPTWKATGVWWGASHLDHSGRRLLASTKTTVTTLSSTDLYVTGLRSDVTRADVLQAFAKFYAANVVMGPTPGSATVTINNPEMFEKALLAGASKEIIIGGIAVDVRKSTVRA